MKLLDHLIANHDVKNDADISRKLEVSPPVISRLRNGKCNVSSDIILRIHEVFNIPVKQIRELL